MMLGFSSIGAEEESTLVHDDPAAVAQASLQPAIPHLPGYELHHILGSGTFGTVWSGVQAGTGQPVAVKILNGRGTQSRVLHREIERMCRVAEHPHVATLLDGSLDHEPPFLVTPLLGESLSQRVARDRNVEQIAGWFEQMARALQYCHQQGIVHCDLKPANVLLDKAEAVRLVDFGQAQWLLSDHGLSLGTFWYMAPEQAAWPGADDASGPSVGWDVYALGATIYRLLTGRLPRHTAEADAILSAAEDTLSSLQAYQEHLHQMPLVPVRRLNRGVDRRLARVVERCLELDVSRRYPDMQAVILDLERGSRRQPRTGVGAGLRPLGWAVTSLAVLLLALSAGLSSLTAAGEVTPNSETASLLAHMEYERGLDMCGRGDGAGVMWLARAVVHRPTVRRYRLAAHEFLQRSRWASPLPGPSGGPCDEDEPADLVELESQLCTGLAFDASGALRPLDASTLAQLRHCWAERSAQHLMECRFPAANSLHRLHLGL